MNTFVATHMFSAFAGLLAPFRRMRSPRLVRWPAQLAAPAKPAIMDAATYAAMVAEAERIAAPYQRHIAAQVAALHSPDDESPEADFPEVEALLMRAGLLSR